MLCYRTLQTDNLYIKSKGGRDCSQGAVVPVVQANFEHR